jgi:DNA invertase Pin-like site-specific DNA recombinase
MKAAIYCRISADAEGTSAGVRRQEQDCRALAKSKGWTVAKVLTDNDHSAYNGKSRPAYDQLLAGLEHGEFDAVVAWKYDRISRTGVRGLTPLLDALDGRPLVCVNDAIDMTSPMGEGMAAMLASMAKQESANIGARVARKKEELAEAGAPAGGKRAFCYEPDGITIRESEAKAFRKAARDVLAGKSYSAVAREWNDGGVAPPQAEQWSTTTVRYVLQSPRHAGLRAHRGEVVGKAKWPGVIDRATHEALASRERGENGQPRRRSLLTRLVRCSCETTMSRDGRSFRCRACGSTIKADQLEDLVEEMVVEMLESPTLAKVLARQQQDHDDDHAALDVAAAEAKLAELDDMLGDGELTRASYLRARKAPEAKLEDARRRAARRNGTHALERFRGKHDPQKLYKALDMDERRAVIAALIDRLVIHPARAQGVRFDVGRVEPIWRP